MRTSELLSEFLNSLRRLGGAASADLLLHLEPAERASLVLVHDGHGAAPELADEDACWSLINNTTSHTHSALREYPSSNSNALLLRLSLSHLLTRHEGRRRDVNERRSQPTVNAAPPVDGALWIALDRPSFGAELQRWLGGHDDNPPVAGDERQQALHSMITLATRLAWSVYLLTLSLQDPVSQLPGRMELQVFLKRVIAAARRERQALGLLLINPDDFAKINHRYGREVGDNAVREIAKLLSASTRQTDGVFRYAGAVFAVVLPGTNAEQCEQAANKLRRTLSQADYLNGAARLTFSVGGTVAQPQDLERGAGAAEVINRAETALNVAKLGGGARAVLGGMDDREVLAGQVDPLSGIFTADTEKDYRNMMVLWETVSLISSHPEPGSMARAFVERLAQAFRPERVVLFARTEDGQQMQPLASFWADPQRPGERPIKLTSAQQQLVDQALQSRHVERMGLLPAAAGTDESNEHETAPDGSQRDAAPAALADANASANASENAPASGAVKRNHNNAYAVPLVARDDAIGCLYLDGVRPALELDSADLIFLNALASQIAVALDRADLAAKWIREKDSEGRRMKQELRDLRQALQHSKLVYQSKEMHAVLETLRRIAPTDATVLILGESGTGKEMLAQTLHELSDRREKPFVTVDCGAIAHTLIEAELFGHVKGAFTGAENASEGRIAQAQHGTLFLDEIGELPLALQTKLLRFVQEREYTAVGSSQSKRVDVRIVAATNRELHHDVAAGTFRADLYHRLQVISVKALPLRQRPADTLTLAHYFLGKFATQYGVGARRLSASAEQLLLAHHWPGNVRELQHCIMRAVLMNDSEVISAEHITLAAEGIAPANAGDRPLHGSNGRMGAITAGAAANREADRQYGGGPLNATPSTSHVDAAAADASDPAHPRTDGTDGERSSDEPWHLLKSELQRQVTQALLFSRQRPVPLGRWLTEDIVVAASHAGDEVARRAAKIMGIPETTFRRHLEKVRADIEAGIASRTQQWSAMLPLIDNVVRVAEQRMTEQQPGEDLLERARATLFEIAVDHTQPKTSIGAALMGVSPPTYKRWLAEHGGTRA